jgi:predicted transposase/invertase (TIGR01784 family)
LLPFAVLSDTSSQDSTLQAVAAQIDRINDRRIQNNITASAAILSGLVLEEDVIQRLLRRDMMRESVIYQSIKEEGREEGASETALKIAASMLKKGVLAESVVEFTGLTLEQVQQMQTQQ